MNNFLVLTSTNIHSWIFLSENLIVMNLMIWHTKYLDMYKEIIIFKEKLK